MLLAAVRRNGCDFFQLASKELQNDMEVLLAAVTENGDALRYASEVLQANADVVQAAC